MRRHLFAFEIGFVWVCLGLFWLWVAITGEKWGSDWLCLGLFGFAFGGAEGGQTGVSLCENGVCGDSACFRDWVCFARKGWICGGFSTEIELVPCKILRFRCAIQDLMFWTIQFSGVRLRTRLRRIFDGRFRIRPVRVRAENRPIFDIIPDFGAEVKENLARQQTKDTRPSSKD
jgi:hypothetical protein